MGKWLELQLVHNWIIEIRILTSQVHWKWELHRNLFVELDFDDSALNCFFYEFFYEKGLRSCLTWHGSSPLPQREWYTYFFAESHQAKSHRYDVIPQAVWKDRTWVIARSFSKWGGVLCKREGLFPLRAISFQSSASCWINLTFHLCKIKC